MLKLHKFSVANTMCIRNSINVFWLRSSTWREERNQYLKKCFSRHVHNDQNNILTLQQASDWLTTERLENGYDLDCFGTLLLKNFKTEWRKCFNIIGTYENETWVTFLIIFSALIGHLRVDQPIIPCGMKKTMFSSRLCNVCLKYGKLVSLYLFDIASVSMQSVCCKVVNGF